MRLEAGTIKRLHVDRKIIAQNKKYGWNQPPITVQTSKGPLKAHRVDVLGPSTFVHDPVKPLSCGARVWIETRAAVELSLTQGVIAGRAARSSSRGSTRTRTSAAASATR